MPSRVATSSRLLLAAIALATFTHRASAYLGGFENADGYGLHPYSAPFDPYLNDHYNAGQYATNNGGPGGTMTAIPVGTGLWTSNLASNNGYNLASLDDNHTLGGQACCDVRGGNFSNFRPGANNVDGTFSYTLDSVDLNGTSPASVNNNRTIAMSFYYLGGVGYQGNDPDVFRMDLKDGAGNVGASFGLADNSTLFYADAAGSHSTSILSQWGAAPHSWIYVRFVLNLATDTFNLGVVPGVPSGIYMNDAAPLASLPGVSILASNAPMSGGGMSNLVSLGLWVDAETDTPGSTGVFSSNKQLLDDFNFTVRETVPEPATAALLAAATPLLAARRRRTH